MRNLASNSAIEDKHAYKYCNKPNTTNGAQTAQCLISMFQYWQ